MHTRPPLLFSFFFFNDTATTEIYTLSLHDALPISPAATRSHDPIGPRGGGRAPDVLLGPGACHAFRRLAGSQTPRSEEHTSELQSRLHLVCRLLLEKKKTAQHATRRSHNESTITV